MCVPTASTPQKHFRCSLKIWQTAWSAPTLTTASKEVTYNMYNKRSGKQPGLRPLTTDSKEITYNMYNKRSDKSLVSAHSPQALRRSPTTCITTDLSDWQKPGLHPLTTASKEVTYNMHFWCLGYDYWTLAYKCENMCIVLMTSSIT